jgi:hypothetical protein
MNCAAAQELISHGVQRAVQSAHRSRLAAFVEWQLSFRAMQKRWFMTPGSGHPPQARKSAKES